MSSRETIPGPRSSLYVTPLNTTLQPAPLSDQELSDADCRRTAMRLVRMVRFSGLQFHLHVGRILLEDLYNGDINAWRARGDKDTSLRKLSSLTKSNGVTISRSVLHRSVRIYELLQRIGEDWSHLGVSHFRAVLVLPEEAQGPLLRRAERDRWTVRQLEEAARRHRKLPPRPPALAAEIKRLEQAMSSEGVLLVDQDRLSALSPTELRQLSEKLSHIRQAFDGLQERLDAALRAS